MVQVMSEREKTCSNCNKRQVCIVFKNVGIFLPMDTEDTNYDIKHRRMYQGIANACAVYEKVKIVSKFAVVDGKNI